MTRSGGGAEIRGCFSAAAAWRYGVNSANGRNFYSFRVISATALINQTTRKQTHLRLKFRLNSHTPHNEVESPFLLLCLSLLPSAASIYDHSLTNFWIIMQLLMPINGCSKFLAQDLYISIRRNFPKSRSPTTSPYRLEKGSGREQLFLFMNYGIVQCSSSLSFSDARKGAPFKLYAFADRKLTRLVRKCSGASASTIIKQRQGRKIGTR